MASDPKKYIDAFFNITKGYIKENEDTSTVKILHSAIDNISSILSKIDKFLKGYDVNVKDEFQSIKEKLGNYKDKAKTSLLSLNQEAKDKGLKNFFTEKKDNIVGKLKEKFSTDTEKSGAPPEEKQNPLLALMQKLSKSIDGLTSATNDKVDNDEEKKASEKEGRLARFKNMLDGRKERAEKRKKEVDAEKNRFGDKDKKDGKGKGLFGMLLSAIGGLSTVILGGFKSILLKFVPMVAGLAGRGIVSTITGLVPWMMKKMVPGLALASQGVLGTVARGALTAAGTFAMGAGKAALGVAGAALTGTAGLVLGGVLLAGAAIYGGYKLYKYLNRNSTGDGVYSDLTRLRLQLYGFNDINREHYHKLFDLEMLMKDYHEYRNNTLVMKKFDSDFKKKVLELFEVTRDEKEKYELLNTWFMRRFVPSWKAFMEAFYSVNSKIYLDDLDKLKEDELFKFVSVIRIPTGIFDFKSIPVFSNPNTVTDKQQIDDLLTNIREAIKRKSDEGKGKKPGQVGQENKGAAKDAKTAQDLENKTLRDRAISNLPKDQPSGAPRFNNNDMKAPVGAGNEGEGKPPETRDDKLSDKASTSINKATGELLRGNKNLEGISTKLDMSKIYNLDPNVLELFSGMAKEYATLTGKTINVNEAFRSREDQAALFNKYGPGRAAPPGSSLHEHGLAIDINSATADELDKLGLMRKYGFTRPIGGEKWHIEPAGVSLNPTLARDNPASRIGAVTTSPGRGGGGYATESGATQYKRNIGLQKAIYESGSSTEINPLDAMKKKLEQPAQASTTGQAATAGMQPPQPPSAYNQLPSMTMGNQGQPGQSRVQGTANVYTNNSPSPMGNGIPAPDYERRPPAGLGTKNTGLDQNPQSVPTYNNNMDPSQMGNMSPQDAIRKASSVTGMNPDTMMAFAKIESNLDPSAANRRSTATGLFQITGETWKGLMGKYGKQYNIPPDAKPTDPYYNSLLGSLYAKENLANMGDYKKAGIREDVALYLAHHFGSAGGNRIIRAANQNPDSHVGGHMSPDAYRSNTSELGNKSVGQYLQYLNTKLDKNGSRSTAPQGPMQTQPQPPQPPMAAARPPVATVPAGNAPYPSESRAPMASPPSPLYKQPLPPPTLSPYKPTLPPTEMPMQPSKALSLDKTESLLSGMSDSLVAIRDILKSIDGKGGMQQQQEQQGQQPSGTPAQQQHQQPIVVDNNRQPSQTSVSMSRRPVKA